MCIVQRRNEVRWRAGQETSLTSPCSNLSSFGSKCTLLKKVLMTWDFLAPCSDSAPGNCAPCHPRYVIGVMQQKSQKFSKANNFKSEHHEHLQFSKTINDRSCTDCQQRLLAAFQVSSCSFVSLLCLPNAFFQRGPVFVLLIIKLFGHSTSYFLKVR